MSCRTVMCCTSSLSSRHVLDPYSLALRGAISKAARPSSSSDVRLAMQDREFGLSPAEPCLAIHQAAGSDSSSPAAQRPSAYPGPYQGREVRTGISLYGLVVDMGEATKLLKRNARVGRADVVGIVRQIA